MKQIKGKPKTEEEINFAKKEKEITQSNLTKCKYCGRSFNETAAVKHIPLCQKKAKDVAIKKPLKK